MSSPAVHQIDVGNGTLRKQGSGFAVQTAIALVCLVLVAIAMVPTLIQVFLDKPLYYPDARFTLSNLTRLFSDPEIRSTLGATAIFCVITVALSMAIGTSMAVLLARTDLPCKGLFGAILFWPLFLSPQVIGFGAIIAYGPTGFVTQWFEALSGIARPWNLYSIVGMALVSAIAMAPTTTLYAIVASRQQDPNHDAAARIMGAGSMRILSRISLPLMRPAIIFAVIMNIGNALETLAIPLIIGGPVNIHLLTTLIYERSLQAGGIPEYGLVAALAVLLIGFIGGLFALQRVLLQKAHRFVSVGPKAGVLRPMPLGKWRMPAFTIVCLYFVFGILTIVGAVFLRAATVIISVHIPLSEVLTWQNFHDLIVVDVYRRSIVNTMLLAVIGAALGTVLIAAIALVAQRSDYPLRRLVDGVAQLPRMIPGLIVGLGVFYASVFVAPIGLLRNTIWILLIAYLIRFISAGYGIISPALLQVTVDFDRAAKTVGAGWLTTVTRIILPLQKHALLSCFVLLMVLIIKEYSAAVFLMAPGSEVIGSTMLSLWAQGSLGPVAALAVVQILLTATMVTLATRLFGVRLYG